MPDMPCTAKLARLLPILGFVALSACHLDPDRYDVGQQLTSHTIDHGNWQ
nr:hypothetical protein [Gemmatimonadota bacterium]NIT68374.1 hypothetical protein [Gemmatimonadota bacterium]NIY36951.1 hypothetical protein [Gemmatimonadota bacterium]